MVNATTVGVLVGVALELDVAVGVAVTVGVTVAEGGGDGEKVGVAEGGTVIVGVGVSVETPVAVPVAVDVAVGATCRDPSSSPPHPTTTRRARTMNSPTPPVHRQARVPSLLPPIARILGSSLKALAHHHIPAYDRNP